MVPAFDLHADYIVVETGSAGCVLDASVMPRVPRPNTNAPTIMVAERAADLFLDGRRAADTEHS